MSLLGCSGKGGEVRFVETYQREIYQSISVEGQEWEGTILSKLGKGSERV